MVIAKLQPTLYYPAGYDNIKPQMYIHRSDSCTDTDVYYVNNVNKIVFVYWQWFSNWYY
jgi:hypothetical protein